MPVKFQMAAQTGILISGNISFGVRKIERTPAIKIKMARTMKVYGRRTANWTIHIESTSQEISAQLPALVYDKESSKLTSRSCKGQSGICVDLPSHSLE